VIYQCSVRRSRVRALYATPGQARVENGADRGDEFVGTDRLPKHRAGAEGLRDGKNLAPSPREREHAPDRGEEQRGVRRGAQKSRDGPDALWSRNEERSAAYAFLGYKPAVTAYAARTSQAPPRLGKRPPSRRVTHLREIARGRAKSGHSSHGDCMRGGYAPLAPHYAMDRTSAR
jgi:hypothetical protein